MPHAALWVVQLRKGEILVADYASFNAARGFVGGATFIMKNVMIKVLGFNAARGFVGGATKWETSCPHLAHCFNAARGFVGGATGYIEMVEDYIAVSMPHAALWVVQPPSD